MNPVAGHWGGELATVPVLVDGGAYNGLGIDAHQSWAFWRAELSPFVESPFVCPNGERATMCLAPALGPTLCGPTRLVELARRALVQLPEVGREISVGVALGVSERFAPGGAEHERLPALERAMADLFHRRWPQASVRLLPGGHASVGQAVLQAVAALVARSVEVMIVGGVDSAHGADAVEALLAEGRLFDTQEPDRMIPGEGAAFLVLTTREQAARLGWSVRGLVEGAAHGTDPAVGREDVPRRGEGLSAVMRAMTGQLKTRRLQLEWLVGDLTSEAWRAREWGFALYRGLAPGGLDSAGRDFFQIAHDRLRVDQVPECFGDLGAATLPTAAILAMQAFMRGDPAPPRCLLLGSSPGAARGAILLAASQNRRP